MVHLHIRKDTPLAAYADKQTYRQADRQTGRHSPDRD